MTGCRIFVPVIAVHRSRLCISPDIQRKPELNKRLIHFLCCCSTANAVFEDVLSAVLQLRPEFNYFIKLVINLCRSLMSVNVADKFKIINK